MTIVEKIRAELAICRAEALPPGSKIRVSRGGGAAWLATFQVPGQPWWTLPTPWLPHVDADRVRCELQARNPYAYVYVAVSARR